MLLSTGSFYCHRQSSKIQKITFMTRRHIIQVIFFSWTATAGFEVLQFSLRVSLKRRLDAIFCWLDVIFLEFLPSTLLIFSFVSMIVRVRKYYGSARTLSKQLRYNHQWVSLKTYHGEKSAVIMMGIVIGVFVITYGTYLHCSFLILFDTTGMASCDDVKYKIPVLVLNSAINPLAYAFFKRDVKTDSTNMILMKGNQVKPSTHVLNTRKHLSSSLVWKSTYSSRKCTVKKSRFAAYSELRAACFQSWQIYGSFRTPTE